MAEVTSSCLPLAEAGATAGTLPYLAPEVLRGSPTSLQSDVWALGVLLYQMATGELPFRGATPFELSVEIMVGTPPKLAQLPEPLQSTLRRCLEKDAVARLAQVRELASALAGNARRVPSPPCPRAQPQAQPRPPSGRRRSPLHAAGASGGRQAQQLRSSCCCWGAFTPGTSGSCGTPLGRFPNPRSSNLSAREIPR